MKKICNRLFHSIGYNIKLSYKYLLLNIIIIVVLLLFFGIYLYNVIERVVEAEIRRSYQQISDQYVDHINYKLSAYQDLIDNIVMNGTIQSVFQRQMEKDELDTFDISNLISSEINSLLFGKTAGEITEIRLYAVNEHFPRDGKFISNLDALKREAWYTNDLILDPNENYMVYTTPGMNIHTLSLIQPISNFRIDDSQKQLGIIKLDINITNMFNFDDMDTSFGLATVHVMDMEGKLLFSNRENSAGAAHSLSDPMGTNRLNEIVITKDIEKYDWQLQFVFPYQEIHQKISETFFSLFWILALLLGFSILLTSLLSKFISNRISVVIADMKKVETGNFEISFLQNSRDEIGVVSQQFYHMVGRLKRLINENYLQKLSSREAELDALQMQINPHFLYNTLETINGIALTYDCREICTVSQNLGEMFRYNMSLSVRDTVRLRDEWEHIRNYLSIQAIRFDDRFEVVEDIPAECMNCLVVKLILQPVIENAFSHGFKGKRRDCRLHITAAREGEVLHIAVRDNGNGISPANLEELHRSISTELSEEGNHGKHNIGIRNVNQRLKLTYGEAFGLRMESEEGHGTTVNFYLPFRI